MWLHPRANEALEGANRGCGRKSPQGGVEGQRRCHRALAGNESVGVP